jgi:alpha-N-arabinofuranosidase
VISVQLKRSAALAAWFVLTACLAMETASPRAFRPVPMRAAVQSPGSSVRTSADRTSRTSRLYTYRRDDATPAGVTRIRVDARHMAAVAIQPDLFGNFVEHLGGVVYGGLWAQLLRNPSLEAVDAARGEAAAPPAWQANEQAWWRVGGKELQGYHSPGYVTLLPAGGPRGEPGRIWQTIALPARRVRSYEGSVAVRVVPEADTSPEKSAPEARLRISLAPPGKAATMLAEALIEAGAPDWSRYRFRLMLPAEAATSGATQFCVEHAGGGAVDVDRVELFPADSVHGLDPEVMSRARAWHIRVLRWPGGNFASGYYWQDGIGPRDERPTRRNAAWGGVESNELGTDEFLDMCRRLGAEPQITVNAGDGTPQQAAAWVRYCNAGPHDRFGGLRASDGHPRPYDVRLWEVGNELYGDWQIGHAGAVDNARRFVQFRQAMLGADPALRLIATGKGDEFLPDGLARNAAWNEALLRAAVEAGGRAPDYLSIHPLVPLPGSLRRFSYAEQFESAMAHAAFLDRVLIPDVWERIRAIAGPRTTRIAVTEWGLIVGGAQWREGPNHDTLAGAVYNALCLNAMLRQSDRVTLANMTAFMHGGGIKKPNGVVIVDPQYYTQQLYAGADLHTPVAVETIGPGADVPARGFLPQVRDVPDVDVFAALDGSDNLVVTAVNRSLSLTRPIELRLDGYNAARAAGSLLTAPSATASNTIANPDAVRPQPLFPKPGRPDKRSVWSADLPPHSVAVITFART